MGRFLAKMCQLERILTFFAIYYKLGQLRAVSEVPTELLDFSGKDKASIIEALERLDFPLHPADSIDICAGIVFAKHRGCFGHSKYVLQRFFTQVRTDEHRLFLKSLPVLCHLYSLNRFDVLL
jgi:hypothetical protein